MSEKTFRANDGREIFYRYEIPDNPRGILLVCHGYAEHSGRMDGVMDALVAARFAPFAPDHRGHGKSAETFGLVESFGDIVSDLETLREIAVEMVPGKPVFVLGHSMGGMLALRHAQVFPENLAGIIPVAAGILVPPDIPAFMIKISHFLGSLLPKLPVQSFFDPSKVTRIPAERQKILEDPLIYKGMIRAKTGSELLHAMNASVAALSSLTLPMLLLHGGDDILVLPEASELIRDEVGSEDLTLNVVPNAFHDVFHEPEAVEIFRSIVEWLTERTAA